MATTIKIKTAFVGEIEALIDYVEKRVSFLTGKNVKVQIIADGSTYPDTNDKLSIVISKVMRVSWMMVLRKKKGVQQYTVARQLYCYICRVHQNESFTFIAGKILRDHTSVIHAVKTVTKMVLNNDPLYTEPYFEIMEKLKTISNEQ